MLLSELWPHADGATRYASKRSVGPLRSTVEEVGPPPWGGLSSVVLHVVDAGTGSEIASTLTDETGAYFASDILGREPYWTTLAEIFTGVVH